MEVILNQCDGVPKGSLFSVRAGQTRRQGLLEFGRTMKFPESACSEISVDFLAVLGRAKLALAPGSGTYATEMTSTSGTPFSCEIEVRRLMGGKPPSGSSRVSGASRGSSRASGPSRRHEAALAAQRYMEKHGLMQVLQTAMQATVDERPDEPFEFMANHLLGLAPPSTQKSCTGTTELVICDGDASKALSEPEPDVASPHIFTKSPEPEPIPGKAVPDAEIVERRATPANFRLEPLQHPAGYLAKKPEVELCPVQGGLEAEHTAADMARNTAGAMVGDLQQLADPSEQSDAGTAKSYGESETQTTANACAREAILAAQQLTEPSEVSDSCTAKSHGGSETQRTAKVCSEQSDAGTAKSYEESETQRMAKACAQEAMCAVQKQLPQPSVVSDAGTAKSYGESEAQRMAKACAQEAMCAVQKQLPEPSWVSDAGTARSYRESETQGMAEAYAQDALCAAQARAIVPSCSETSCRSEADSNRAISASNLLGSPGVFTPASSACARTQSSSAETALLEGESEADNAAVQQAKGVLDVWFDAELGVPRRARSDFGGSSASCGQIDGESEVDRNAADKAARIMDCLRFEPARRSLLSDPSCRSEAETGQISGESEVEIEAFWKAKQAMASLNPGLVRRAHPCSEYCRSEAESGRFEGESELEFAAGEYARIQSYANIQLQCRC